MAISRLCFCLDSGVRMAITRRIVHIIVACAYHRSVIVLLLDEHVKSHLRQITLNRMSDNS